MATFDCRKCHYSQATNDQLVGSEYCCPQCGSVAIVLPNVDFSVAVQSLDSRPIARNKRNKHLFVLSTAASIVLVVVVGAVLLANRNGIPSPLYKALTKVDRQLIQPQTFSGDELQVKHAEFNGYWIELTLTNTSKYPIKSVRFALHNEIRGRSVPHGTGYLSQDIRDGIEPGETREISGYVLPWDNQEALAYRAGNDHQLRVVLESLVALANDAEIHAIDTEQCEFIVKFTGDKTPLGPGELPEVPSF